MKKRKNEEKIEQIKKKQKTEVYQYGNYPSYYSYRNKNEFDNRITLLKKFENNFENKNILDIGCNIGNLTFEICKKKYLNVKKQKYLINAKYTVLILVF
jgi:2-polyprenyl-3-methyl-5-hydroxy-6-metoxy-1,4-benzoquinol methylase